VSDLAERLRLGAHAQEITSVWNLTVVRCSLLHEAADEIERLRGQVAELLPYALQDAKSGVLCGKWPTDHGCEPECGDCEWYAKSVAMLERIEAGEFQ
jgi:hypothetical protein